MSFVKVLLKGGYKMFYERLKAVCNDKGVKITPLLKELGISTGITGNWKKDILPKCEILIKIADKLEVSTDYLLERTDNPEINK